MSVLQVMYPHLGTVHKDNSVKSGPVVPNGDMVRFEKAPTTP